MTADLFPAALPLAPLSRPAGSRVRSRPSLPGLRSVLAAPAAGLLSLGPRGLVGLLMGQSARARRASRPQAFVALSCQTPSGEPAVQLRLP
ncbi:hypothetical protein ACRC7T_12840 [Segnochrobactraceae bacterium EtOH-i3]